LLGQASPLRPFWPAIDADSHAHMSVLVDVGLVGVVAVEAKRLQLTSQELIPIATVWLDVIGHGSGDNETARLAHPTQRLGTELLPANPPPALKLVPCARR
jgi:hypothetical protein